MGAAANGEPLATNRLLRGRPIPTHHELTTPVEVVVYDRNALLDSLADVDRMDPGGKTFRSRWLCRLGIDDDLSARRALNERTYPEFHKVVERDHAV